MTSQNLSTTYQHRIWADFPGQSGSGPLSALCLRLMEQQEATWPDYRKGNESLRRVIQRMIRCAGSFVLVQHNPGRMASTTAPIERRDIAERPCFLCVDSLPGNQEGILYRKEFVILCNPMPVFARHFTIAHLRHRPQAIYDNIGPFLQLVKDFGEGWTVLYNGPKCGASAPDHLHFQAVPSGQLPIEKEARDRRGLILTKRLGNVLLYRTAGLGREAIVLGGDDAAGVGTAFTAYVDSLTRTLFLEEEPMISVLGMKEKGGILVVVFPRRKHRPEAFFRSGEERVVVSPAVVEMAGVIVTPVQADFERLDTPLIEAIFQEVSLESEIVRQSIETTRWQISKG